MRKVVTCLVMVFAVTNAELKLSTLPVIIGQVVHTILAITDFVSDVQLLIAIQDTRDTYDDSQEYLDAVVARDQYEYEYCHPLAVQPEWSEQVNSKCDCVSAEVICDDSATAVMEDVALYSISDSNTTDYAFLAQLVESSVSCQPYLWAKGSAYAEAFTFSEWLCSHCQCEGNLYYPTSFPLMATRRQFTALYDEGIRYCDPDRVQQATAGYNDFLDNLIIVCWVFVFVGGISQCCTLGGMGWLTFRYVNDGVAEDDDHHEGDAMYNALKMAAGFLTSLFEDVPQTIVAMYYLQFLYADDGFSCFTSFAEYPSLNPMSINPQDSITIILLENPSIAFAVVMSMVMIVLGGILTGFKILKKVMKATEDDTKDQIIGVAIVVVATMLYVFSLTMPIAAVAKFDIAPKFNKEWQPAFITFVIGCIAWGGICCACGFTALLAALR